MSAEEEGKPKVVKLGKVGENRDPRKIKEISHSEDETGLNKFHFIDFAYIP